MTSVIFEIWLQAICRKKKESQEGGTWRNKYCILLRNQIKPEVRLYSKRPKNLIEKHEKINIEDGYQVLKKSSYRGKPHVCHLSTNEKEVFLAPNEKHICDFICFFLRTFSKLKSNVVGCQSFIVRPEKTEDAQRIGCFNSICNLAICRWGIILSLQLSGSVLGQWPLRCIRTYECSGQGRFVFEVGNFSPTSTTRLAFRTKVGQDGAIYNLLDEHIEETARLESVAMDQISSDQSRERAQRAAFSDEMIALCRVTEVTVEPSFDAHLKKISRGIHDQLSDYFGERGRSVPIPYETEGRSHEPASPSSLPTPDPLGTGWAASQPSVLSDEVFPEMAPPPRNNKLINYVDMQSDTPKRQVEEIVLPFDIFVPILDDKEYHENSSFEETESPRVKPPGDPNSYIHPDKYCSAGKDNYLSSICCEEHLKKQKSESEAKISSLPKLLVKNRGGDAVVRKPKPKHADSRLYHSARKTPPHNYFRINNPLSSIEDFLDSPVEPADYAYFSKDFRPVKVISDKLPIIPQKPIKSKLENLKMKKATTDRRVDKDLPLVHLANH